MVQERMTDSSSEIRKNQTSKIAGAGEGSQGKKMHENETNSVAAFHGGAIIL